MRNKETFWIPLAGSILLLLVVVLAILSVGSTLSFAATSPPAPADVEGIDSWTWRGPSHLIASDVAPMVKSLIIDPAPPYTVYVGTNQGVYRSADSGSTWQPGNGGLGGYGDLVVSAIDLDLTNHQRLVIGTWGYGVFQSTDGGLNWTRLADPVASPDLQPSAAPALDAPQVRAGGPSDIDPEAGSDLLKQPLPAGVLTSRNRPADEEQVETPRGLPASMSWTPVRDVAIHPSTPTQLFACVDNGYGLYVSSNSGGSWTHVSGLPVDSCRTITFAPSNSLIRYASFGSWSTTGGFYRTTNGGASWTEVGSSYVAGTVTAVAIHPTNSNIVLAATSDYGLYRSTNGGDSWTDVSTPSSLPDVDFYSVAFAPGNPNVAYAGGYSWVYRSGDAGATWANADASYPTYYVQGLAIHPTSSSTVLVGNNYFPFGGVYRRTSDGSAFALAASGMSDTFVLDIEQDPNNPNVLYAATWGAGVFRSDDGGQTWNHRFGVPYIYSLEATQGPTGTILYAGTFYTDYGVLRSRTNGDTWTMVSLGWYSDISFDIKSLDGGSQNLIAATANGVELSYDGGQTWPQATGLDQGLVLSIAQSPFDSNRLLAATYGGGVWSSTNGGSAWGETSTGLGSQYVYDVAYAPWDPNTAYAATLGVYRTANGGGSWFPSGVSGTYVRALDTRGAPGFDVFAGTHNQGVYMAPQHINLWLDLNQGLGEHRVRSLVALDYDTLFAGTNGRGAWEYTIVNPPQPEQIYLPLVLRNYLGSHEEVILYENFEGTFPGAWSIGDGNSDDGLYYWGKRNCRSYGGSYSGWAAGAGSSTLSCGSDYRNNMSSWMIRGPFSLADASDAELTFKLWLNTEYEWDYLCRYASIDGSNFSGYCATGNSGGWVDIGLDLQSAGSLGDVTGQPNVWIALRFISDSSVTNPDGAHVDNIEVRKWVGDRAIPDADVPVNLPDTMRDEPSTWSIP